MLFERPSSSASFNQASPTVAWTVFSHASFNQASDRRSLSIADVDDVFNQLNCLLQYNTTILFEHKKKEEKNWSGLGFEPWTSHDVIFYLYLNRDLQGVVGISKLYLNCGEKSTKKVIPWDSTVPCTVF